MFSNKAYIIEKQKNSLSPFYGKTGTNIHIAFYKSVSD